MHPGTVILLSSPLDPSGYWRETSAELRAHGITCLIPDVPWVDEQPPAAVPWIATSAQQLHTAQPTGPLVFVAHGAAGALTPVVARTQRAARRPVAGYVFVDATLPRTGRPPTHLDLLRAADPAAADHLHAALHGSGQAPDDDRPPGGHDFWTETLPVAPDWPDAPCVYIRLGDVSTEAGPIDWWARSAAARGWSVDEDDGGPLLHRLVESVRRLNA